MLTRSRKKIKIIRRIPPTTEAVIPIPGEQDTIILQKVIFHESVDICNYDYTNYAYLF